MTWGNLLAHKILNTHILLIIAKNSYPDCLFFAQSGQSSHIKLVLHLAAQLSIFYTRKSVVWHHREGPDLECTAGRIDK